MASASPNSRAPAGAEFRCNRCARLHGGARRSIAHLDRRNAMVCRTPRPEAPEVLDQGRDLRTYTRLSSASSVKSLLGWWRRNRAGGRPEVSRSAAVADGDSCCGMAGISGAHPGQHVAPGHAFTMHSSGAMVSVRDARQKAAWGLSGGLSARIYCLFRV